MKKAWAKQKLATTCHRHNPSNLPNYQTPLVILFGFPPELYTTPPPPTTLPLLAHISPSVRSAINQSFLPFPLFPLVVPVLGSIEFDLPRTYFGTSRCIQIRSARTTHASNPNSIYVPIAAARRSSSRPPAVSACALCRL
jgi:hypothetical protein